MNYDELFGSGVDTGAFVLKAQVKTPVRDFREPVLQAIFERLGSAYRSRVGTLASKIEEKLSRTPRVSKSLSLVVYPDSDRDDLFKAKGAKSDKTRSRKQGIGGIVHAGSRGGKFWIDKKGNVRYDKQPSGDQPPKGYLREASDEEVVGHVKKMLSPTIFVGHDDQTTEALLSSGKFTANEVMVIEAFREDIRRPKMLEALGDYSDISEIGAGGIEHFDYEGTTGHRGLLKYLEESWMEAVTGADLEGTGDKLSKNETREMFYDIVKKYDQLPNSPEVIAALKETQARMDEAAGDSEKALRESSEVTKDLFDRFISATNPQHSALDMITLMNGLDLLARPTSLKQIGAKKGRKAVKALKGLLLFSDDALENVAHGRIDFERTDANEAQLAAYMVAGHLANHYDWETDSFAKTATRNPDGSLRDNLEDFGYGYVFKKTIERHTGKELAPIVAKHYTQRLMELAENVGQLIVDSHKGKSNGVDAAVSGNSLKKLSKGDAGEKSAAWAEQTTANLDKILESKKNGELKLPKSMVAGKYGEKGKAHQLTPDGQPYTLFTHQKQAVNWMETAHRGILAHGTGTGKTTSAVAFIEHMKEQGKLKRGIFFLPPGIIQQWAQEIRDFVPDAQILDLTQFDSKDHEAILKSEAAQNASYILVSKGKLTGETKDGDAGTEGAGAPNGQVAGSGFINALSDIDQAALYIDEIHQGGFKTPTSAAYQLTQKVLSNREYAFGMTATPVPNNPVDLFHINNLMAPGTAGTLAEWEGKLANYEWNPEANEGQGGFDLTNYEESGLKHLNEHMRPWVNVRKFTDPDVREELKGLITAEPVVENKPLGLSTQKGSTGYSQHALVLAGIPKIVSKHVNDLERQRIENGEEGYSPFVKAGMLKTLALMLQRQANISPEMIDPTYRGPAPKIEACVSDVVAHFKPGGAGDYKIDKKTGERVPGKGVVIFCNFKKAFPILKRELAAQGIDPSVIGEIHSGSSVDRGATQDAFSAKKLKVLLVGIAAGGAGLNLQHGGNRPLYLDQPYTPGAKEQSMGRLDRPGQKDVVVATNYHSVIPGQKFGTDDFMQNLIRDKGMAGEALLAQDFNAMHELMNKKMNTLGSRPVEIDAETQANIDRSLVGFKLDRETIEHAMESLGWGEDKGPVKEQTYQVDPRARKNLPASLQGTFNMGDFQEKRKARMQLDGAKHAVQQLKQVAQGLDAAGMKDRADYYRKRAEKFSAMLGEKPKKLSKEEAKTQARSAAGKLSAVKTAAVQTVSATDKLPPVKKTRSPYDASSGRSHAKDRDTEAGAKSKDDYLPTNVLDHFFKQYKKIQPKTTKQFIDKVIKPVAESRTEKQYLQMAKQVLHHFRTDGVI